ncbi:hypothetical protein ACHAWF_010370 [Thalassiosira exigua]
MRNRIFSRGPRALCLRGRLLSAMLAAMVVVLALMMALCVESASPSEDLHDLDDEYEEHGSGGSHHENNVLDEKQLSNEALGQNQERGSPTAMERFSRAVAAEIMRRIPPSMQLPFQFRPPWGYLWKNIASDDMERGEHPSKSVDVLLNDRRVVGAWCPPDSSGKDERDEDEDEAIYETAVVNLPESSKSLEATDSCSAPKHNGDGIKINDVQPGTVVYVFPEGEVNGEQPPPSESSTSLERADVDGTDEADDGEETGGAIHGTRSCLIEMGERYDDDEQVVQYTLLKQEPVELGNVDVHRRDFAYQPVALTLGGGGFGGSTHDIRRRTDGGVSHEVQARIRPEEEVLERIAPSPSPRRSPWTDTGDQQVSFRWWSWVSQYLHYGDGYVDDDDDDEKGIAYSDAAVPHSSDRRSHRHGDHSSYRSIYEESGRRPFAGGSHGEIWRAKRRCPANANRQRGDFKRDESIRNETSSCDDEKDLIVKRLRIENGFDVLEAGLREVYFGELLAREVESSNLFTTYVDHFFREGASQATELWIVFENAGPSLRSFLYTPVEMAGFVVWEHSAFWRRLRRGIAGGKRCNHCDESEALAVVTPMLDHGQQREHERTERHGDGQNSRRDSPEGRVLLREVLKQLIASVAFLHERGIVHRDIKPSNIMCKTTPQMRDGAIPPKIESVRCLLGDFSSAWDEFSGRNLYSNGPSSKEQTDEYAPPEVLFQGSSWSPFFGKNPFSYDSWSIGVVALEMLLGTPNVFSVDQRTTALLTSRLQKEGASPKDIQRALYLAALSQFCIYVPSEDRHWPLRRGDPLHLVRIVKSSCTLKDFHSALRARDPLGIGFDDDASTLLHMVWRLLDWNPLERLSPSQALLHPYFSPHISKPFTDPGANDFSLEHQTLDPRVDISSDTAMISEFKCPKCGKVFSDHMSCQRHARGRRHAQFCTYDRTALPPCLNAHSMLPTHSTSGYCDVQGRRPTIEDFQSTVLMPGHQFYGVFDGHLGNLASKYAASSFYHQVERCLSNIDESIAVSNSKSSQSDWKEDAKLKLVHSFEELHSGIIKEINSSPGGVHDESGTTATILYVTNLAVVVANVGDSRAIISNWSIDTKKKVSVGAVQLTVDHVASSETERAEILARGGFVSESGGIDRVNGSLAVSRSLGDAKLAPFLSQIPHVLAQTKEETYEQCGKLNTEEQHLPCFIILASDGLWDVISNQEAVDLAWQVIKENQNGTAFQEAAEVLTQEAYVRGSSDNIGVCVVAIT